MKSFVTEAHASSRCSSPAEASTRSADTTPAALCEQANSPIWRSASTGGDTKAVDRRHSVATSPATRRTSRSSVTRAPSSPASEIRVAGTAPIPREGEPPEDAYDQTRLCLEIIGGALEEAGASFDDVVRTRLYLVDADDYDEVARAHGEVFRDDPPGDRRRSS